MKMKKNRLSSFSVICLATVANMSVASAESFTDALTKGKAYGDLRLRYEAVDQDNARDDATALTLRTRLGYKTGAYNGFSGVIEFEDNSVVLGQDDYSVPVVGTNGTTYSVVADPETTELDQFFIQYKSGGLIARYGSQVITLDGHRHVGHVGWRQDRQTFDAFLLKYTHAKNMNFTLASIDGRNRIFAEAGDQNANDILLNFSYKTGSGKLAVYNYALEDEFGDNVTRDTFGLSYSGAVKTGDAKILYTVEFASQETESDTSVSSVDTDYTLLEAGYAGKGFVVKLGLETLGSDSGAGAFTTPLATLHKFNGWADIFLGTPANGLEDLYIMYGTKIAKGSFKAFYHKFSSDEGSIDYGTEVDLVYAKKFTKNFSGGIKYASYSADDFAVDTDKVWLWTGLKF